MYPGLDIIVSNRAYAELCIFVSNEFYYYWHYARLYVGPFEMWMRFQKCNFKIVLMTGIFRSSYDNALRSMSQNLPALVQVMAWSRQATSHNLNQ